MHGSATTVNGSTAATLSKLRAEVERLSVTLAELEKIDPQVEPDLEQISYSISRAARVLDLSERTVWALVKSKQIPSYTVGSRRLISRTAIDEFVKRQQAAA